MYFFNGDFQNGKVFQLLVDLIKRNRPLLGRVPLPEHVEIEAMQNQNLFIIPTIS
jgi:hypothetical protein